MECLTGDDRCAEILSLQVTSISWNHSDRGSVLWETPGNKKASCCCWKNHHKTLLRTIISGANQQSWCCSGNRVTPAGEEFKTGVKNLHIDFQPLAAMTNGRGPGATLLGLLPIDGAILDVCVDASVPELLAKMGNVDCDLLLGPPHNRRPDVENPSYHFVSHLSEFTEPPHTHPPDLNQ